MGQKRSYPKCGGGGLKQGAGQRQWCRFMYTCSESFYCCFCCIFEYTFAFGRLTLNPFSLKVCHSDKQMTVLSISFQPAPISLNPHILTSPYRHPHRRAHLKCSLMQQKFLLFYPKRGGGMDKKKGQQTEGEIIMKKSCTYEYNICLKGLLALWSLQFIKYEEQGGQMLFVCVQHSLNLVFTSLGASNFLHLPRI